MNGKVLIVGVGMGLSASIARLCHKEGMQIALASRKVDKLSTLSKEIEAKVFQCDASDPDQVKTLFEDLDNEMGTPDLVVYNPSARVRGTITELDPLSVQKAINITSYGAFLVAQQSVLRMLKKGGGSILFTGASASVKGFANSSVFAMGKFALRGLAQSLARELHPKNIHIGHFIIDGGIAQSSFLGNVTSNDEMLDPDAIAKTYLEFHKQHRSSWSWEIELRPWVENF